MSTILCIIDGMTDPAFSVKDYKTLSSMKFLKNVRTVPEGFEPESLTCILTLLGVKQIPLYLRGYVEALGSGIAVHPDDLILRGSWFSLDSSGCCTVPTCAPAHISIDLPVSHHHIGDYKSLIVLPGLADDVENICTHPPYACAGQVARRLRPSGNGLLEALFDALCDTKQCMIPWGQSRTAIVAPFPKSAAVICGTQIVKGIAKLLNMKLVNVPGATGDIDTDLQAKTDAALCAAEENDFVLLHFNGADEASHRRDNEQKQTFLQSVDVKVLTRLIASKHTVFVCADHSTDPHTGCHCGEFQPLYTNR